MVKLLDNHTISAQIRFLLFIHFDLVGRKWKYDHDLRKNLENIRPMCAPFISFYLNLTQIQSLSNLKSAFCFLTFSFSCFLEEEMLSYERKKGRSRQINQSIRPCMNICQMKRLTFVWLLVWSGDSSVYSEQQRFSVLIINNLRSRLGNWSIERDPGLNS
jgi:hypothetical protein